MVGLIGYVSYNKIKTTSSQPIKSNIEYATKKETKNAPSNIKNKLEAPTNKFNQSNDAPKSSILNLNTPKTIDNVILSNLNETKNNEKANTFPQKEDSSTNKTKDKKIAIDEINRFSNDENANNKNANTTIAKNITPNNFTTETSFSLENKNINVEYPGHSKEKNSYKGCFFRYPKINDT